MIDYRKEYERCTKENNDLLQMVEKYCRYEDKYEVLNIFDEINKNYVGCFQAMEHPSVKRLK